jgi:hypothetical protein
LFQSIGRGWVFLKQSWVLGQRSPEVLFPALLGFSVSVMTTLVMMLPLGGLIYYIRKEYWGQVSIGVLIGLLITLLVAIAHMTSIPSSQLSGRALSGQPLSTLDAWKRFSDLGGDLFLMGLGKPFYPVWTAIQGLVQRTSRQSRWEDADHLLIPILANEEISLQQAPGWIKRMQTDNCVFPAEGVGIRKVSVLLTVIALSFGLTAGLGAAWLVVTNGQDASLSRVYASAIALFMIAIFTFPVVFYLVYAETLFNTCLYLWGVSIRDARKHGKSGSASVPSPLAVAIGLRPGR